MQPGEILYDQGDSSHGVFVVLSGSIEIVGVSNGDADRAQGSRTRDVHR